MNRRWRLEKGEERHQTKISDATSAVDCESTEGRNPQIQHHKNVNSTEYERRSNTMHQRFLAVFWAIGKLRSYLESERATVRTDHYTLRWILSMKNVSGRLSG